MKELIQSFLNKGKIADYQQTFGTPSGKRVLKDLLDFCNYNKPTYVVGDPYATHYNEGMRRCALRLVSFLKMDLSDINNLEEVVND